MNGTLSSGSSHIQQRINMSSILTAGRRRVCSLALMTLGVLTAPVFAQAPAPASSDAVAVVAGIDIASQYIFRGVRQNATGVVVWPMAGVNVRILSNRGPFERIALDGGFWNSVNTGDTGSGGPASHRWYESRVSAGVDVLFRPGVSVATSYTAYMSPNDLFTTAKEAGVRVAMDDRRWLGRAAVHPYALMAFEIDATPGVGQLDGGLHAGRYLEVGATPGTLVRRATVSVPIKVGLSLRDYYELGNTDNRFGFASVGGFVSVPLGRISTIGRWHARGGIEVYRFGDTAKVFNGGDRYQATASVGIGIGR
jgi:hypothetical protein